MRQLALITLVALALSCGQRSVTNAPDAAIITSSETPEAGSDAAPAAPEVDAPATTTPSAPDGGPCGAALCEAPTHCVLCEGTAYCYPTGQGCPVGGPAVDPASLQGTWSHHRERDPEGGQLWTRNQELPPSRFRGVMTLGPEGSLRTLVLHPGDAHYEATGRYRIEGRVVHLEHTETHHDSPVTVRSRFEVLGVEGDELRLRSLPDPAPPAPAPISEASIVGSWIPNGSGSQAGWSRCSSSTPICPLVLNADHNAIVLVINDSGPAPRVATWALGPANRLIVTVRDDESLRGNFRILAATPEGLQVATDYSPFHW